MTQANRARDSRSFVRRSLVAGALLVTCSAAVSASDDFDTRIAFNPNASPATIYSTLQAATAQACRAELRSTLRTSLVVRSKALAECKARLMQSAVRATSNPSVAALHESLEQPPVRTLVSGLE